MKSTLFAAALLLTAATGLVTEYKQDTALHVEHEARYSVQVTEIEVEVNGEPQERPDTPMPKSETHWHVAFNDEVRASDHGHPTEVRRHFEAVDGKTTLSGGPEERSEDLESPFEDLTLDLSQDGEDVHIKVVEGKQPEHEGALEGHKLTLSLDALLPAESVEKDASWDLDNASIREALGLEMHKTLFPRKTEEPAPAEGGEGRGRRGRNGGMMRVGGQGVLAQSEWTGKATLKSLSEDVDGTKCAKIELALHSAGELAEPAPGAGGGRRERMPHDARESAVVDARASTPVSALRASTYSIDMQGTLLFALETRRPLRLNLEGKVELESNRESTRNERTMRFHTKSEGEIAVKVEVAEGKLEQK